MSFISWILGGCLVRQEFLPSLTVNSRIIICGMVWGASLNADISHANNCNSEYIFGLG